MAEAPGIPNEQWSEAERWVWDRIAAGEIADLNVYCGREDPLDPNDPEGWDDGRRLSVSFLQTILTKKSCVDATPFQGVKILGALVDGDAPLDLAHARLERLFWLERSRLLVDVACRDLRVDGEFSLERSHLAGSVSLPEARIDGGLYLTETVCEGAMTLISAKVGGALFMTGSTFEGAVDMDSLAVAGSLFMRGEATFKADVNLTGAEVGGTLELGGSTFEATVTMDKLSVASSVFMSGAATFKGAVILRSAKVGSQLDMSGSTFKDAVNLSSLVVSESLFMREKATFKGNVYLNSTRVGGQLAMAGSTFEGAVNMDSLEVADSLFMSREATFDAPVYILFGRVGGDLDLSGAVLAALDLTGTRIAGDLRLGSGDHPCTRWNDGGRLVLRNTHAGALQDRIDGQSDAWPESGKLQLAGFTYDRLGGFRGGGAEADMLDRSTDRYTGWLARDPTYSPQPYEQLAKVFLASGYPTKANDILYAGRERERNAATGWKWLGLSLLKWFIGYGLGSRYFWSLRWVGLVTLLGAGLLWLAPCLSAKAQSHGLAWNLACSLDLLLPVVELNKEHADFVMKTLGGHAATAWIMYYFYVHKLFGWVLASFLIAGLGGLTQKT